MADTGFLVEEDQQAIEEARRRRKRATGSTTPTTPYIPTSIYAQRAADVENGSAKLLPTRLVLSLAGLTNEDRDIARAAKLLAKRFDIGPKIVFGQDWQKIRDPYTGDPMITLSMIRRASDNFAPAAIASM